MDKLSEPTSVSKTFRLLAPETGKGPGGGGDTRRCQHRKKNKEIKPLVSRRDRETDMENAALR